MKVVKIIWIDSHYYQGWQKLDSLQRPHGKKIMTVGFEIKDNDEAIIISNSFTINHHEVAGVISIPKSVIKKYEVLHEIENIEELLREV